MDRVEQPLRADVIGDQVTAALEATRADDVEHLVAERVTPPVDRYWRRAGRATRAGHRVLVRRTAKHV